MAQLNFFAIVGDSNVRRHLSPPNTKGRPLWSNAKFIPCSKLSVLATALESAPPETDACVLACISNFLTASAPSAIASVRVKVPIQSFIEKAVSFARARPQVQVFACPPMYRTTPLWYRDGMSEISITFFSSMHELEDRPANLWVLPAFSKASLEADGVHLDVYSGLEYIHHLFDASQELFSSSVLSADTRVELVAEKSRAVETRVVNLEQDHSRLSRSFEFQSAVNAEFMEHTENVRNEEFIMVQGLDRLPKMDPKAWQVQARASVDKVITDMGLSYKSKYVQNSTGKGRDSKVLYKAKMESAGVSREIRDKFSAYFAGGKDSRPTSLSSVSIRNCVTPGTLARIAILQLLGRRYRDANKGSRFQVVAYESRPLLKLTPPSDASDTRVMTYNYIEAITKLPTNFSKEELDGLMSRISPRLHSSLKSTLFVVTEDMLSKKKPLGRKKKSSPKSPVAGASTDAELRSPESSDFRTPTSGSGSSSGRKRGLSTPGVEPASKK